MRLRVSSWVHGLVFGGERESGWREAVGMAVGGDDGGDADIICVCVCDRERASEKGR